jgi:hypothetical protein
VASLPLYHAFAPLQRASLRRADSTDGRPDSRHDAPGDAFERAGVH